MEPVGADQGEGGFRLSDLRAQERNGGCLTSTVEAAGGFQPNRSNARGKCHPDDYAVNSLIQGDTLPALRGRSTNAASTAVRVSPPAAMAATVVKPWS